jgi:hypothetical protein
MPAVEEGQGMVLLGIVEGNRLLAVLAGSAQLSKL